MDGSDITSATFETLSSIGDMAVPFCAPFLEINLTLIDRDSLGHSEQIEDINVYWQLNGSGGYDEQHKVSYSSFSSNYTEVFPTSSRIVFPMYAHANWGKSETDTVTGMKIEILFKNGINAQVKIDRIALAFDGRQINNNSAFLSAAAYCYKYTQDEEWLEQNLPKFRKAMQFYFTYCTQEGEELATKANFVGHDGSSNYGRIAQGQWSAGVGHGIGDGYWDCISNPLIDAYTNIYYYKALQAMAYLEGAAAEAGHLFVGRSARAQTGRFGLRILFADAGPGWNRRQRRWRNASASTSGTRRRGASASGISTTTMPGCLRARWTGRSISATPNIIRKLSSWGSPRSSRRRAS